MDKQDIIYRQHSAKEHIILTVMILLVFFALTSQYNSDFVPSFTARTPTGAAAVVMGAGSFVVWGIIMLLLSIGIIAGIIIWWRNHKKIQVQRALQQEVDVIIKAAERSSPSIIADPLARKLNQVQQELVDIPLRSATSGHIINSIPAEYKKLPPPPYSFRYLLPKKNIVHNKKAVIRHKVKHRESIQEKMLQIKKEIDEIKTKE